MLQSMRSAAKPIFFILLITFVGGFLFADASGLLGTGGLTPGTTVASVDGTDISYQQYSAAAQSAVDQAQAQKGSSLTLDERARVEQQALDQLVEDILLQREFTRRGITVSDAEVQQAALTNPHPQLLQSPELQTDGRFDIEKYRRFMSSPSLRQSGQLAMLEAYYRDQIARNKLYGQVAGDVYVTDARLWQIWQDTRDSAQVTFAAWRPELIADSAVTVTDAEIRTWYDRNKDDLEQPGRAAVSLVKIPRTITAADSAATLARVQALRAEIVAGTKFEDVARRESADTASGNQGGDLGRGARGRFVPAFENAAFALRAGELSQPVLTQFGYHLIKVDERKGDTLALRHILVRVGQSDSSATRTDRLADQLSSAAAQQTEPARFDSAARRFALPVERAVVFESEPLIVAGRVVPDVSAWAFSGVRVGETSELFSDDDGYYLARLDTLRQGGVPDLDDKETRDLIRRELVARKKIELLVPRARQLAQAAANGSLESAAAAQGVTLQTTGLFTRVSTVPGLGQLNQAIGAAFALPVGAVSAPVSTPQAVYVLRVDRRVNADRTAFEAQKAQQRDQLQRALQQRRVEDFLTNLRKSANVKDRRKDVLGAAAQVADES